MKVLRAMIVLLLLIFSAPALAQGWVSPSEGAHDPLAALAERPPLPEGLVAVEGLHATVHGHPRDHATVRRLADHAARAVPEIAARLGLATGPRMRVVLAEDEVRFHTLQPGRAPGWADGTAWPHQALIFLRSPRARPGTAAPLEQVLDHEITHVLLGQAFGRRPVPTWLQEGLAQWMAGEVGPETARQLARASLAGGLLTLDDIAHGFPSDPARAALAYAQSADLIAFIVEEHGEESLGVLVGELARGAPVNAALRAATGTLARDLDAAWRSSRSQARLDLALFTDETLWFGLGGPVLFLGWLGVRRRNRQRLEAWREAEARQGAWPPGWLTAPRPARAR